MAPPISWLVEFKFVIFLVVLALVWLFTKSTEVLLWFLYVVFFPLLIVIWYIPRIIWRVRSWNLTFAYINTLLSTSRSLRFTTIIFALCLLESAITAFSGNVPLLWLAIALSFASVVAVFSHRIILIFRPSRLYDVHVKLTVWIMKVGRESIVGKIDSENISASPTERMSEEYRLKWASNLQMAIILNRGCKFLSRKLEEYQRSRLTSFFYALNFLLLTGFSVLTFSLVDFALYKINPASYSLTVRPNFFIFFYYSANTLLGHSINEVVEASTASRVFHLSELFVTFLLVIVLFTLWSSVKNQREADEIKATVACIRKQGEEMDYYINSEFGLSVDEALSFLIARKLASMIKIIEFLSDYENPPLTSGATVTARGITLRGITERSAGESPQGPIDAPPVL